MSRIYRKPCAGPPFRPRRFFFATAGGPDGEPVDTLQPYSLAAVDLIPVQAAITVT
jgi:hypothetical protein